MSRIKAAIRRLAPCTLKTRVALFVSVLALAASLLASLTALHPMRKEMRTVVGDQEMALLNSAAAALDQEITAKRVLLRAIAEGFGREPRAGADRLQLLLEQHPVLREEFYNVVAFNTEGEVIANLGDRRAIGNRAAKDGKSLVETVQSREGVISRPFRSPLSGKPAIILSEPLIGADGEVTAVLGGALSLVNARFMGQFLSSKPGSSAYFILIDQHGTIIYHPDPSRVLHNVWREKGGAAPVTGRALAGFEGWTEGVTKEGVRALIAATHLRRTGWTLALVYPVEEAFAPVRHGEQAALLSAAVVTVLAAAAGLWLTTLFLQPLARLHARVEMLSEGTADIGVLDSYRRDEIGSLSRALFALAQQRQAAENRLALLSRTDTLTGLHNRRMFEAELPAAIARADRQDTGLALAFLDVDHFKGINDTHGHAVGDAVLCEFADRLRATVRKVDVVARLSGDEFVVIFELLDTADAVEPIMSKLIAAIRAPFMVNDLPLAVTATVGVAYSGATVTPERLLKVADEALYRAKADGRDTWTLSVVAPEADAVSHFQ